MKIYQKQKASKACKICIPFFIVFIILFVLLLLINSFLPSNFKEKSRKKTLIPSNLNIGLKKNEVKIEKLSIEKIFSNNHNILNLPREETITLIATGDVIPARSVNFKSNQYNNFKWAFEKTADVLNQADITLINLESPLIQNCPLTNSGMIFCGSPKHIEGLVYAGIDVANFANNHLGNYGNEGIQNTANLLQQNNILATGISGAVYKEIKGVKFAFLGYNDVEKSILKISQVEDEEKVQKEIKEAKQNADIVIVSYHWGDEYTSLPNKRQQDLAHLAVDFGADLIIGNHPHWIQPVEIYKDKLIIYAHGNFIFDQMWSKKTEEGIVGKYIFYKKQLVDIEFLPVLIEDYGQPHFLKEAEKEQILNEMKKTSLELFSVK